MKKTSLPLRDVYRLLELGPVVLLTTVRSGKANVMATSWHMMVDFEPPTVACVISNRDTLKKFRLTPLPAAGVGAPPTSECYANLECKVIDTSKVDRYSLFILEVVKAWIDRSKKRPRTIHHCGRIHGRGTNDQITDKDEIGAESSA